MSYDNSDTIRGITHAQEELIKNWTDEQRKAFDEWLALERAKTVLRTQQINIVTEVVEVPDPDDKPNGHAGGEKGNNGKRTKVDFPLTIDQLKGRVFEKIQQQQKFLHVHQLAKMLAEDDIRLKDNITYLRRQISKAVGLLKKGGRVSSYQDGNANRNYHGLSAWMLDKNIRKQFMFDPIQSNYMFRK